MCLGGVLARKKHGKPHGNQFFVETRQRAVTQECLEISRSGQSQRGSVRQGLKHVGDDAPRFQQGVVDVGDFGCDLIPLQEWDPGLSFRGH
jgi:hypothetical protein